MAVDGAPENHAGRELAGSVGGSWQEGEGSWQECEGSKQVVWVQGTGTHQNTVKARVHTPILAQGGSGNRGAQGTHKGVQRGTGGTCGDRAHRGAQGTQRGPGGHKAQVGTRHARGYGGLGSDSYTWGGMGHARGYGGLGSDSARRAQSLGPWVRCAPGGVLRWTRQTPSPDTGSGLGTGLGCNMSSYGQGSGVT